MDYAGRLSAHLPLATRVIMLKSDGSVLIHSDGGSYKPLNWMAPPCTFETLAPEDAQKEAGVVETWKVIHQKTSDILVVNIHEIHEGDHRGFFETCQGRVQACEGENQTRLPNRQNSTEKQQTSAELKLVVAKA